MGIQLRTSVRIKQDPLGNERIYPWKPDGGSGVLSHPYGGVITYLEIDNRKCMKDETDCFTTANEVPFCILFNFTLPVLTRLLRIY